jgi:hypothetical protein
MPILTLLFHWIILYKIYLFFVNWNCTKETNCFLVFCIIKMHKILKFCIFGSISLKPLELEEIHQLNTTRSSRHNQNKEKMLQNWMKNKNSIYLLNMWNLLILCPFSNSKICCGPQKPIMMIILQKTALKWMKNKVKILIWPSAKNKCGIVDQPDPKQEALRSKNVHFCFLWAILMRFLKWIP